CLLILTLMSLSESDSLAPTRGGGASTFVSLLVVFALLTLLANWIGAVVAGCFLLATPPRRGARGLSVALLVLAGLVVLRVGDVTGFFGAPRESGPGAGLGFALGLILLLLVEVARLTLLALLLRALCLDLGMRTRAARATLL